MGAELSQLQPEELAQFKKLPSNTLLDTIEIPERPENRKVTDRWFIIVFAAFVVLLLPFLTYTLVYSDIDRLFGYDQCGNICGKQNAKYDEWDCTGKDLRAEKYLQYYARDTPDLLTPRECKAKCDVGYVPVLGVCMSENQITEFNIGNVASFLNEVSWRIVLVCFLCLGLTLVMLFLFRSFTSIFVWTILVASVLLLTAVVGTLWYAYSQNVDAGFAPVCIIFTIFLIILICVMAFMHRKIRLVIVLMKEALKAAFAMPQIIFLPILTFVADVILLAYLVITSLYMFGSGTLTQITSDYWTYELNPVMIFTLAFNFWMVFWATQIIYGIQYMVIAGAISKWYFAKNKAILDRPVTTSASNAFKFHLGSVALGSLIITLIAMVRALLSSLIKNKNLQFCANMCMKNIERFVKYLSKNSYIMTAMHGKPFYKSGKRAGKILLQNIVNIATINYIGDFVLFVIQLLIVTVTLSVTYAIIQIGNYNYAAEVWVAYGIVAIVAAIIAHIFFAIFETIIDTLFLCFCEDSLLNDGMARPFAMSRDLMEFVENSKKIFGEKKPL